MAYPLTGKRTYFGRDRAYDINQAEQANAIVELQRGQKEASKGLPFTVGYVIAKYSLAEAPHKPWKDSTRRNKLVSFAMYQTEFGNLAFLGVDRVFLGDWLRKYNRGDTYNGHRQNLIEIWRYAIASGYSTLNEPEMTLPRSTSLKIKANQRIRKRLNMAGFKAIHEQAPLFLKLAMELSLITLQSRAGCAVSRMRTYGGAGCIL